MMVCTLPKGHTGIYHSHPLLFSSTFSCPFSCPSKCRTERQRGTNQHTHPQLHSINSPLGQSCCLCTMLTMLRVGSEKEKRQNKRIKKNKTRKGGTYLEHNKYASHLLVLSSVSSEKLQALPDDPLILVASHKLSAFTTAPVPAHSSL